ncbi:hypothetical protein [Agarilytica rhodophyticola]|uniref:hypothetical protein n=1 Tax=Agarilytica rhodophyticola TaxID=1737490 RepID=UPI000B349780|nr:hypothetical protein [Agarilytica rhodophyticola]
MIELYNYFLSNGFKKARKKAVVKYLSADIYIKITPQSGSWNDSGDLYIYLFSSPFGMVMTDLFKDKDSLAWDYSPRKLRKDTEGCLGMVMCGFDIDFDRIENSTLTPSDYSISVGNFLECINTLNTDGDIFDNLYKGALGKILVLIEGLWVYLYFANKLGYSIEKTLADVEENDAIQDSQQAWHLRKCVDIEAVELFNKLYGRALTQ